MSLGEIRNLDYVVLLCDDLRKMKAFYQEVMGFPVRLDATEWVEMSVGSSVLALRTRGRPYDGPSIGETAGVQLAFRVSPSGVDRSYQELLAAGVEVVETPTDSEGGHRTLFFRDHEGNVLEIYAEI